VDKQDLLALIKKELLFLHQVTTTTQNITDTIKYYKGIKAKIKSNVLVPHPKLVMFGIVIVLAIRENDFDLKILLILDHEDGSYNNF
jgi:hypothetical protein